jgi:K+-sensing histidine kinase KdpD
MINKFEIAILLLPIMGILGSVFFHSPWPGLWSVIITVVLYAIFGFEE